MKKLFWVLALIPTLSQAEIMDVDFSDYCKNKLQKEIEKLDCDKFPPIEIDKVDDEGKKWKIRFHFGFTRTQYHKTNLSVQSELVDIVVRDVEMYERTSAEYYNPANWRGLDGAIKWIDEPTNTFMISFEKEKNNFYVTIFHPKYLKSIIYKKTEIDGQTHLDVVEGVKDNRLNQPRPEGYNMFYLQNTHANVVWQIGYGRQITLFDSRRGGKLTYIPRADIGITTGAARTVHIQRDESGKGSELVDSTEKFGIQGLNASIGHRLEYQRGKASIFIDHKTTFAKMHHSFGEGTIDYNLRYTPITFGIGIDLFSGKAKKKRKK